MNTKTTIAVVAAILLVGCAPRYETNRDAVVAITEAFCANTCVIDPNSGNPYTEHDCTAYLGRALCDRMSCSAKWEGSDQAVDECLEALSHLTCSSELLPPQCLDVL